MVNCLKSNGQPQRPLATHAVPGQTRWALVGCGGVLPATLYVREPSLSFSVDPARLLSNFFIDKDQFDSLLECGKWSQPTENEKVVTILSAAEFNNLIFAFTHI